MLLINHCSYEVDKDLLKRNSDYFSNYYELAENGENIDIDTKYDKVIKKALDIIMLRYVNDIDIVLTKELLYFLCVKTECLDILDRYVLDNLTYYRKNNNVALFYYDSKYVNEMNVKDCLFILKEKFNSMREEEFMLLLSVTIGVVHVDEFLPYLKYFSNEGCKDHYFVETKYKKYDDVIDDTWKERLDVITNGLIIPDGVAILGGSIAYILNKHLDVDSYTGDIDLYIIGETKKERVEKMKACIQFISKQFHDVGMEVKLSHYLNVYSLACEGMPTIQVINSRENCIEDIFNIYDLSACRVGVIHGKLIADMCGIKTLITQTITINENANTKMFRLLKYVNRGFSIQRDGFYYVDGKYVHGSDINFKLKGEKYNIEYTEIKFNDIKEYDVCWVKCYTNINNNISYCIKNTLIVDNILMFDDFVIDNLNKKIRKQKIIKVGDRNILMNEINKNITSIPIIGNCRIQYKEKITHVIPENSLCNVTVSVKLNEYDCSMYVQVVHVQVKRINN